MARSIDELSRLDTFDGMTDEEIQSLLDYKYELGYQDGYAAHEDERQEELHQIMVQQAESIRTSTINAFTAAMSATVDLEVVDDVS